MIIYLVKSFLLLGIFLGLYKLLLENEKMHQVNRFFLLFAIVFGLTAPLITFDLIPDNSSTAAKFQEMGRVINVPAEAVSKSVEPLLITRPEEIPNSVVPTTGPVEPGLTISTTDLLIGIYGIITLVLLIRFGIGLLEIRRKVKEGEKKKIQQGTLILLNEPITPQSFFSFIFLEKEKFKAGEIEGEILEHELTHSQQLHSLDVMFVEFLKVIFWFNPLIYMYKHAIQLNHEFLADESVVSKGSSVSDYQNLLLRVSSGDKPMNTTSSINYSLTKKRFTMMMKNEKHLTRIWAKKILLVPVVTFSVVFFSNFTNLDINDGVLPDSEIIAFDSTKTASPYYEQFSNRLNTYNEVYNDYRVGQKTKRDVLYQRIRLVWLHQRLSPQEQRTTKVPDLPENFSDDIPLTQAEQKYQDKYASYITYRESLSELPSSYDSELYEKYKELRALYNDLDFHAQIFIVDNLPDTFRRHLLEIEEDKEKNLPPFHITISSLERELPLHYLDENGNAVATTIGELSESEIDYLMSNTKKSLITQVYPLPVEKKPTDEEIEKWQDEYYYQVWVDGEVIENKRLLEMDMDKLHHFRIHEIRWNGNRRVPYDYQVLMYTYEAFEEMVEKYRPSKGMIPIHQTILRR